MAEASSPIQIPNRALFKAVEVCELVNVQPYVLRSWEAEFPDLGITRQAGAPRVYRRADVERVVRIRNLLLVEGLTLAGARRRLEEEARPVGADAPVLDELIGQHARERLTEVKRGLRSILDLLAGQATATDFKLTPLTEGKRAQADARSRPRSSVRTLARGQAPKRRRR